MTEYVVGKVEDIPEDEGLAVRAGRHLVAIYRVKNKVYALHNSCPHKGGAMCYGIVVPDKLMVRCPWHYWNWSLETGELDTDPRQKIRCYDVKVEDGEVVLTV